MPSIHSMVTMVTHGLLLLLGVFITGVSPWKHTDLCKRLDTVAHDYRPGLVHDGRPEYSLIATEDLYTPGRELVGESFLK